MNIQKPNYIDDLDYEECDDEYYDEYEKYRIANQEDLDKYFMHVCTYPNLEQAKYLLTSKELKIHANVHVQDDAAFANLINTKDKGIEIGKYLVFELNIEKTSAIERMLNYDVTSINEEAIEIRQAYKRMFEMRELNKSLNKDLSLNNDTKRNLKI